MWNSILRDAHNQQWNRCLIWKSHEFEQNLWTKKFYRALSIQNPVSRRERTRILGIIKESSTFSETEFPSKSLQFERKKTSMDYSARARTNTQPQHINTSTQHTNTLPPLPMPLSPPPPINFVVWAVYQCSKRSIRDRIRWEDLTRVSASWEQLLSHSCHTKTNSKTQYHMCYWIDAK